MKCDSPVIVRVDHRVKDEYGNQLESVPVGCGKCYNCKRNRIAGWSFRLMKEMEISQSAYFITLTYDTENVPLTSRGFMTLEKKALQDFFKRLRYYEGENKELCREDHIRESKGIKWDKTNKIKYYAVGEYGEERKRPHYHAIVYNIRNSDNIINAWPFGSVDIQEPNVNAVDYTLKYLEKDQKVNLFKGFDGIKEFALMSKGLGSNYIDSDISRYLNSNMDEYYLVNDRGFKISMPRYYRDKIYKDKAKLQLTIKKNMEEMRDKEEKEINRQGINYDRHMKNKADYRQKLMKSKMKKRFVD